tara:strand:+ start:659 stop:1006 length:348 start_codon:yes stop_codon:yes gene_type:complete
MALGNANTTAQARGKNKSVIVKRRKEVVMAKGYNSFSSSPMQASNACRFGGSLGETFYHNGSRTLPAANDVVYSTRRANPRGVLEAGHYKIVIAGRNYNMQVGNSGVVSAVDGCR